MYISTQFKVCILDIYNTRVLSISLSECERTNCRLINKHLHIFPNHKYMYKGQSLAINTLLLAILITSAANRNNTVPIEATGYQKRLFEDVGSNAPALFPWFRYKYWRSV